MTVTIPAGQTHGTISIPLIEDSLSEASETVTVKLTDSVNAPIDVATATGTILDDDEAPELSIDNVTMLEGRRWNEELSSLRSTLNKASGQDVKVLVTPTAGTAKSVKISPVQAQVITIPAGATSALAKFNVSVKGDTRFESDETFSVVLSTQPGPPLQVKRGRARGRFKTTMPNPR
jgi:hypothetical protein